MNSTTQYCGTLQTIIRLLLCFQVISDRVCGYCRMEASYTYKSEVRINPCLLLSAEKTVRLSSNYMHQPVVLVIKLPTDSRETNDTNNNKAVITNKELTELIDDTTYSISANKTYTVSDH